MRWHPQTATWVLAGYWGALMLGRILSARLLGRISKPRLLLASGIGSVGGCLVLLGAPALWTLAAGAMFAGLSFAAIYPTTLAMAGDRYPRFAGTVFGLLFAVGLLGGMAFPWALGHVAQAFGVRAGMVLPAVGATMICLLVILLQAREAQLPAQETG